MAETPPPANDTWQTQKFKNRCDCEYCKLGLATTHNDPSHDQTLHLKWPIAKQNDPAVDELTIVGGTTKCARVMSRFFAENKDFGRGYFENKAVLEVGSGTGLVGIVAAMLGSNVILTDQSIVMELLESNVERNIKNIGDRKNLLGKIDLVELFWGVTKLPEKAEEDLDVVIGCDLIFAKENIPLLLNIYHLLCPPEKNVSLYFAHIYRFKYEKTFFEGMQANGFKQDLIYEEDEILIFHFTRESLGKMA